MTALGVLCCFALFVCLTLLASFFLPSFSHLSLKHVHAHVCVCYSVCYSVYTPTQIKYVCGEGPSLPSVPSHLMECFTGYLEKLSVARAEQSGVAVIVIDGADLIQVI